MAVMKVCCGCMSTRSGTLAILLLYLLAYIGGIVFLGVTIGNGDLEMWYKKYAVTEYQCLAKESIKDSWWCTAINDLQYDIKTWAIVVVILLSLFLVFDLIALFGTSKGTFWPLLPWIILEFVRLATKLIIFVMVIIVWAVYLEENADESYLIATGVMGAAAIAFFFYLWLCVVSYFQLLREIDQIGKIHEVNGSPSHKVTPFVVEPYDNENPYDNLSENTRRESLAETISVKSSGVGEKLGQDGEGFEPAPASSETAAAPASAAASMSRRGSKTAAEANE